MARWQLGDKDAARKWYLAGAAWMERYAAKDEEQRRFRAEAATLLGISVPADPGGQPAPQDERQLYTLILDAYPEAAWAYLRRGLAYVRAGEAQKAQTDYEQAVAQYTRAIQASARWALFANRANAYAELGKWEKASADYAEAIQDEACDLITRYRHGLLRLHLGDRDGYRKACGIMSDRFSKQENVAGTELALWVCVLAPDSVADLSRLVQWAERLLAAQPNNIVYMNTLGATLYRAGRFEDALKLLSKASIAYKPADELRSASAYNSLFLAMAHSRLQHAEEARKWMRKAISKIDASEQKKAAGEAASEPVPWNRRLTLRLLRTEAENLMKGQRQTPKQKDEPR
jgi:tetratricopeptide (TPR) repeat protein